MAKNWNISIPYTKRVYVAIPVPDISYFNSFRFFPAHIFDKFCLNNFFVPQLLSLTFYKVFDMYGYFEPIK